MNTVSRKRGALITDYLTQREVDTLTWVACGHPTKQIADYFRISPKTVEKHRAALCRKLHAHSAVELTRHAIELGLIEVNIHPLRRKVVRGFARYIL